MNPLCRCICHLATKKREEQADDFAIDFEAKSMSYTLPHTLFQRPLIMLYFTDQKGSAFVLSLMQALVEVSLLEIKAFVNLNLKINIFITFYHDHLKGSALNG